MQITERKMLPHFVQHSLLLPLSFPDLSPPQLPLLLPLSSPLLFVLQSTRKCKATNIATLTE